MKKSVSVSLLFCLAAALPAYGQESPPPLPPAGQELRMPLHVLTPEQLEQWREERRQRREAWQQMSPEERHQLRRDIRDAGHALYPRNRRGRDARDE
jgi:uncharacterized membrane protein